jgi:hypothetical protein
MKGILLLLPLLPPILEAQGLRVRDISRDLDPSFRAAYSFPLFSLSMIGIIFGVISILIMMILYPRILQTIKLVVGRICFIIKLLIDLGIIWCDQVGDIVLNYLIGFIVMAGQASFSRGWSVVCGFIVPYW